MRIALLIIFCVIFPKVYAQNTQGGVTRKAEELYNKGKEYFLKGEYAKANEEFKKADEILSGRQGEKRKSLAIPAGKRKVNATFSKSARKALLKKNSWELPNYVASKKRDIREITPEGIKSCLKLLRLMPDNPDIHYDLGIEYLKERDYFDAAREFKETIKLNPEDGNAYYNLGILYEVFFNDKKTAGMCYKKYLKINPEARDRGIVKNWIDSLRIKSH